jgi:hypothetical protein
MIVPLALLRGSYELVEAALGLIPGKGHRAFAGV